MAFDLAELATCVGLDARDLEGLIGSPVQDAQGWFAERGLLLRVVDLDNEELLSIAADRRSNRLTATSRSGRIERFIRAG